MWRVRTTFRTYIKENTQRNKEALALFTTDLDLQQALEKWMVNKKLGKLLDLWVKGLEVDWKKLYGEKLLLLVPAPAAVSLCPGLLLD